MVTFHGRVKILELWKAVKTNFPWTHKVTFAFYQAREYSIWTRQNFRVNTLRHYSDCLRHFLVPFLN